MFYKFLSHSEAENLFSSRKTISKDAANTSSDTDWWMSVSVILDIDLHLQAKLKKRQEAANAKILEAEKRIKVCVYSDLKWQINDIIK